MYIASSEASGSVPNSGMGLMTPFDLPLTPYSSDGASYTVTVRVNLVLVPFQTSRGYGMRDTWSQTVRGMYGPLTNTAILIIVLCTGTDETL